MTKTKRDWPHLSAKDERDLKAAQKARIVGARDDAARAMLAALKEVTSHYHEADNDMVRAAIAQAEAAGIGEE